MTRLYLLIIVLLASSLSAQSQGRRGKSAYAKPPNMANKDFLNKQWWIGLKAGTNLADAALDESFQIISPTNYDVLEISKQYDHFNKIGSHATVEISFCYKQFSVSLQPTYRHSRFTYSNAFVWSDPENTSSRLELTYDQEQKIDYTEIPLLFKYDVVSTQWRPYVQVGAFYSFLVNAVKSVGISGVDYASGGSEPFVSNPVVVGAADLFARHYWGLVAGAGVNYHFGNIRLNLDFQYAKGMSNINSHENRFSNDRLSGIGDALDDIRLNDLSVSFGCLFPMRFLSKTFTSIN